MTKIPESLKQALREKRVIPFIGAGVSRNVKDKAGNALFPDWPTLLRNTVDKLKAEGKDAKASRVEGALNDHPPDYLEAAKHARDGLPDWYGYLQKVFKRSRNDVTDESLNVARLCWELGSNLLITGNYENVLTWACPSSDAPELWKIESIKEQVDLLENNATTDFPTVWHLHGHISDVRNLILTPEGYATLYPQENEGELKRQYETALNVLRSLFAIRPFLFIGFSMDDKQFESQMKFVSELFQRTSVRHYILLQKDTAKHFERREYLEPVSFENFEDLPLILAEMAATAAEGTDKHKPEDKNKKSSDSVPKIPFNVPFRSKGTEFIGRDGKPEEIREALNNSNGVAIGQAVGIEGMGGLGKTQLAVEYAYKYKPDYPNGVIWFTADGDMEGQLRLIALENNWVNEFDKPENQLIVARQKVKNLKDALLVFDNVNDYADIEPYLPKPDNNTHILATSREKLPKLKSVELFTLNREASRKLIVETAERQPEVDADKDALEKILDILDGLPLALEMAGAYLREVTLCSWQEYLDLLQKKPEAAFDEAFIAGSFTGHDEGVYRTLRVSDRLLDKTPYLREILDILTWSGTSSMGISLLSVMLAVSGKTEIMRALSQAVNLRLIKLEAGSDRYSIHRLLAKVRREEIPLKDKKEWVGECAERIGAWFTENKDDFTRLSDFESELEHLEAWEQNASEDFPEKAVRLIYLKAYPAYHHGRYKEAARWIEEAHEQYERRGLDEPALLADILNDLGHLAGEGGALPKALNLQNQALEIRKEVLGEKHPDYAMSLNNVGTTYGEMGSHQKALNLLNQALEVRKEVLGEKHPDYARSLSNVGVTYGEMGDHQKALNFQNQALALQKEILGEKHPDYARFLNNVGATYSQMGDHEKAFDFQNQVLAIQKEILGEKHPDYAGSLNNVGWTLLRMGDAKTAKEYLGKAVSTWTETLGPDHPSTLHAKRSFEEARIAVGGKQEAVRIQLENRRKKPRRKR